MGPSDILQYGWHLLVHGQERLMVIQSSFIMNRLIVVGKSQFAVNTTNGTFWELVAISTTPVIQTGSYYRYAFQFASFPDYPKFGIWRDGYYIMVQHGTAAGDVTAASFNRSQMIAKVKSHCRNGGFAMPNLPAADL